MRQSATAISPTREENFAEWYQQVIAGAELAENAEVRGCIIFKPWGYAIWENIQGLLDRRIKETGHKNVYFPLLIPLSFLQKEAEHVEGFAKECAIVTHHRLEQDATGRLVPSSPLPEPLVIRPTSETIIGAAFSRWVQSYRDLPLRVNQWANVVRWELRPRPFLRTTEFLWQEGHTAHETQEEALEEALHMLDLYEEFLRTELALPAIKGEKTESERFPGAVRTFTVEVMVGDRKAVQAGTSHFLGQNFARANDIRFLSREGKLQYAWTTSWGVSTRLIGTLIMTHGDDNGLVLPPPIAPLHVVVIPVYHKEADRVGVWERADRLAAKLRSCFYRGSQLRIEVDRRELGGGAKNWYWIKKGVPLRVELGPRELATQSVSVSTRDDPPKEKQLLREEELVERIPELLESIHGNLYQRALAFRQAHTRKIDSKEEFFAFFTPQDSDRPEIHGGFALTHFCGLREVEQELKEALKISIRCIPLGEEPEQGICPFTGKPSSGRVLFAKGY